MPIASVCVENIFQRLRWCQTRHALVLCYRYTSSVQKHWALWWGQWEYLSFHSELSTTKLLVQEVPRRNRIHELLAIWNMMLTKLNPTWESNIIVPPLYSIWWATLFTKWLSQTEVNGSQSGSTVFSRGRLDVVLFQNGQLIKSIRDAVRHEAVETLW